MPCHVVTPSHATPSCAVAHWTATQPRAMPCHANTHCQPPCHVMSMTPHHAIILQPCHATTHPAMPLHIPGHAICMLSHTYQLCPGTVGCHSPFPSFGLKTRTLKGVWLVLAIQVILCTLLLMLMLPLSSPSPPALLCLPGPFFQGHQHARKKKLQHWQKH